MHLRSSSAPRENRGRHRKLPGRGGRDAGRGAPARALPLPSPSCPAGCPEAPSPPATLMALSVSGELRALSAWWLSPVLTPPPGSCLHLRMSPPRAEPMCSRHSVRGAHVRRLHIGFGGLLSLPQPAPESLRRRAALRLRSHFAWMRGELAVPGVASRGSPSIPDRRARRCR